MKCRRCEHEAMVPADSDDAAEALAHMAQGLPDFTPMECVYCGAKGRCSDYADLAAADRNANGIRAHYARVIQSEREKVARLQEGRW